MTDTAVEVHAELAGETHLVGTLHMQAKNGRTTSTFTYTDDWGTRPGSFALEPALRVGPGPHTTDAEREIFGSIGDSAPDTWGRQLMRRLERKTAEQEKRTVRTLTEVDFLLGVADIARLGALRFRRAGKDTFQSPMTKGGIPPFIELPRLLSVTERVLRNEDTDEDFLLLFAPGSSLGGARPKASLADQDGHLAIAKFPKDNDEYSVETWEELALRLATKAGIQTADHRLQVVANKPVLISRRFDRSQEGHRLPFMSAMSMLGTKDREQRSYPELVDVLREHGANPISDAAELFRRMVFNILASNVDDHLRNHGFLWNGTTGWNLSPAYDLNPVPRDVKAAVLSTNISLDEGTCSVDLAFDNAEYFHLKPNEARSIIKEVAIATATWRQEAEHLKVKKADIDRMASAFEHDELQKALSQGQPAAPRTPRAKRQNQPQPVR